MILLSPVRSHLTLLAASLPGHQVTRMSTKKSPEELRNIFEKYAAKEGDPDQLSKEELKLLIQAEFPNLLKGPNTLDDLFQELDKNGDGEVSFEEFQLFVKKISQ
ncbi:protein S100-G [Nycticebus coucang]|uniref:protein S100-G n=1 Tax=Nycticebus coucang TaxID=9470 RepID=UPI00234D0B19|nr:protein S100-G [Nycticebus coucang]